MDLQQEEFFGQVRKFFILPLPASFPSNRDANAEERAAEPQPHILVLAAVAQAKLIRQNSVGMPYFDAPSSDLGSISEVIEADSIVCLAGRVKVQARNRWACIVRPDVTARFRLVENSVLNGEED